MNRSKVLPYLAVGLCIPGVALRTAHLLGGFELNTGLPIPGNKLLYALLALFAVAAVLYAVCAMPLKAERDTPFETLLGTRSTGFRMAAVIAGMLLIAGGAYYLFLTVTTVELDAAVWARVLESIYAVITVVAGICLIGLCKAQNTATITEGQAKLTLAPLIWSCLHLLVTYRMTCVDPKLPSFAVGLIADILLVLGFYHLARLLFAKPRPAQLGFFSALAVTVVFSDLGGYCIAYLMGMRAVAWDAKTLTRSILAAAGCIMLLAELAMLTRPRAATKNMDAPLTEE
ncbi:hypothetical protein NE562_16055 [Butyricicoccus faecihominis]|uniref:hypothetical protein n=1 Tax=Butyricicoccus faecihominis TaxID=1712515 RepID=UPI002478DCA2|nr:hypothetical protein [Butyricicoccus faecihominis]MCQ5131172.1 hypothetical protein [Butyricicoccus faecihominis]